jgi:hypothetical protein
VTSEVFGDVARVQLGAAVNRLAVPLHDDGDFHPGRHSTPEER